VFSDIKFLIDSQPNTSNRMEYQFSLRRLRAANQVMFPWNRNAPLSGVVALKNARFIDDQIRCGSRQIMRQCNSMPTLAKLHFCEPTRELIGQLLCCKS